MEPQNEEENSFKDDFASPLVSKLILRKIYQDHNIAGRESESIASRSGQGGISRVTDVTP